MNAPEHIQQRFEAQPQTIYRRSPFRLEEVLDDPDAPLELKFTAVLATFARLELPLSTGDFQACIPPAFWAEHLCFGYPPSFGSGSYPIFWLNPDTLYFISIGPRRSSHGLYSVLFVADNGLVTPREPMKGGTFEPPPETVIKRFTLCHPFLQAEMHDPTGIYLYRG